MTAIPRPGIPKTQEKTQAAKAAISKLLPFSASSGHRPIVRTWNIAKHLARSGWEVTVVTPHPSIYRNPDDSLKN